MGAASPDMKHGMGSSSCRVASWWQGEVLSAIVVKGNVSKALWTVPKGFAVSAVT
jgi:L-aminopeptidase/D-esterase-like protein